MESIEMPPKERGQYIFLGSHVLISDMMFRYSLQHGVSEENMLNNTPRAENGAPPQLSFPVIFEV